MTLPIRTLQITSAAGTREFQLFDTSLGYETCRRILSGQTYSVPPLGAEVRTIVDVGANVGASSVYFALTFPRATIFAFEPSLDSFELLVANTRGLNVHCFPFGLFGEDRQAILHHGQEDPVTSSIGRSPEALEAGVAVTLRNVEAALESATDLEDIDILKVDTEGCELSILGPLADYLPDMRVIFVEFHSERDRLELDRLLLPTHALFCSTVRHPCRGELCYVARRCLPAPLDEKYGIRVS